MKKEKRKTGTKEWAESNFNIGVGCEHDCRYCYARANALRFGQVPTSEAWTSERLKTTFPSTKKKEGWIMFPTTHDITPFYLEPAVKVLKELLGNGNKVLIVTKPHKECIETLCRELEPWNSNILFRFTIGCSHNDVLSFWEPGAPSFDERVDCLIYAFGKGYATSVSMEPMLGSVGDTYATFSVLEPYVTDKIWIGKMNRINSRVKKIDELTKQECERIVDLQSDKHIMWLVNELRNHPKVEWKDSIKEVMEKNEK